ncbi:SUMF1/EgtB/PvdO family nonheme iron enzyme [Ideonella azotifigens]|uniref:Sulfatase-modifying factor enzyme-like domain-containing protein n=1 Tax=Ideonella azotifigens TaxID=513160 RepID=A0ABP3VVK5_9BURK|nr:SUMF1/EgtB/PvdO family nonheme iron enzyme [Ideonella azotifigens]MCD2344248.1 SUMF1/EgtB/PvdO family nonheme iron enzyme [Ideonella azotifigens]
MNKHRRIWLALACSALAASALSSPALQAQNELLLQRLQQVHKLDDAQVGRLREILRRSGFAGQGNPAISRHPQTPEQCRATRAAVPEQDDLPAFERICGGPDMAPLYNPARERPDQAHACIDQYEFPDIPCEYPAVWVKAREAAQICEAIGKRLCDAHEWEGACEGALQPPDYRFDLARGVDEHTAVARMRDAHNRADGADKHWSYGPQYQRGVCATGSQKTPGCEGGGWNACGSNTYPAGSFPGCRSALGVYDLNGNAAEHMNLPLTEAQMASTGSLTLGVTEMKGSWFVFDAYRAHEDWCRWRAPFWHGSHVLDLHSHANYHLGFRCCKTLPAR